ncbi:hypothetical protein [Chitinophaga japonensis]|uniref:DUF4252 domain-containing protein n=1 Tax=Chitinophaga japonensis TaxID=104662 RepID=A0A562SSJ2_CHIJA|nr:hypothetical protein [Chitinophaga japonensis]TWI84182.1 hypothetical protein LX66_4545 [Chitinophaga japonensis]
MKQNRFAYATALLASVLFAACQQPPDNKGGKDIPFDTAKAWVHAIHIDTAAQLTRDFRAARERLRKLVGSTQQNLDSILQLPSAEAFNRDAIAVLLNQEDAQGIRIYYGRGSKGEVKLVLVPIDSKGNDIVTTLLDSTSNRSEQAVGYIPGISTARAGARRAAAQAMENGQRCDPPPCGTSKLTE